MVLEGALLFSRLFWRETKNEGKKTEKQNQKEPFFVEILSQTRRDLTSNTQLNLCRCFLSRLGMKKKRETDGKDGSRCTKMEWKYIDIMRKGNMQQTKTEA